MDAHRRRIADAVLAAGRAHDAREIDRLRRFRNIEPDSAELLGVLVRAMHAKRILEIGTSTGYSTIWLADAAEATGGAVTSVEIDPERVAAAAKNLADAGLNVELRNDDGAHVLEASPDASWDFVFLDAERDPYVQYWPHVLRVLRPHGGMLAIDNVLTHASQVAEVTALIEAEPSVTTVSVPSGAGLRLVVRG